MQVKEGYIRGMGLKVGFRSLAGLRERGTEGVERTGGRGRKRERGDHPKRGRHLSASQSLF